MAGYICFYKGDKCEVRADDSYKAQQQALDVFQGRNPRRKVKGYDIAVVIAEKDDGTPVVHSTAGL